MTRQERMTGIEPGPYRLTVDDFLLLDRSGAFSAYARTELLAGEIFYVNAQHRPHARMKMRLYEALTTALRRMVSPLEVLVEASVLLSEHDLPEPDLTLTTQPDGDGPVPGASVALVVEVSDATLAEDLGRKLTLYAAAGVPEYWVVDVTGRTVHQFASPSADGYGESRQISLDDSIDALTIDGLTISLNIP